MPDWRMPGRSMVGSAALSAAVHGAIAIVILLALGYPFLIDEVPEPTKVEIVLEEQPPAEPIKQSPA
ncbi:hypothetical protein, partial [Roseitalea porphyridii]|uniref:hypothetical protein n=1 Tax=Roseitalea porphyridii TaxID=1852022 RepID=UPI0032EE436F